MSSLKEFYNIVAKLFSSIPYLRRFKTAAICLGCLAVLFIVQSQFSKAHAAEASVKVLFIGNSYIFAHNMPHMFHTIAKANNIEVEVGSVVKGGATLKNHLENQSLSTRLSEKNWNYVVLQEQSQMMAFNDDQVETESFKPAVQLVNLIRKQAPNAQVIFYTTWGRKNGDQDNCRGIPEICTYEGMQNRLNYNYKSIAKRTGSMVAPVGQVWQNMRKSYPSAELYAPDGGHPSEAGAYLAAYTFYKTIFRQSSNNIGVTSINIDTAKAIQNAVSQTMR